LRKTAVGAVGFVARISVNIPRTLIGASALLLTLSAVFGILIHQRTSALRMEVIQTDALRKLTEQLAARREKDLKAREATVAATSVQFDQAKTKMASAESELLKAQTAGDALQAKLRESDTEIANLRKRIVEAESKLATDAASANPSAAELQAQLEEARKQVDAAEREKALLADKIKSAGERPAQPRETEKKRRSDAGGNPGIRGTVLAVNQAYNFVVLDLGGRQGVEPNSEMLVLRGGTLIGKIRISSVEPATAIGDIISSSLARGVQVQPGDIVVYAGTNF
jgi:hypothetical protein